MGLYLGVKDLTNKWQWIKAIRQRVTWLIFQRERKEKSSWHLKYVEEDEMLYEVYKQFLAIPHFLDRILEYMPTVFQLWYYRTALPRNIFWWNMSAMINQANAVFLLLLLSLSRLSLSRLNTIISINIIITMLSYSFSLFCLYSWFFIVTITKGKSDGKYLTKILLSPSIQARPPPPPPPFGLFLGFP